MKDVLAIPSVVVFFLVALGAVADAPAENITKVALWAAALTAAPGVLAELWFRWDKD